MCCRSSARVVAVGKTTRASAIAFAAKPTNPPPRGPPPLREGEYAGLLARRFRLACRRLGLNRQRLALDTARFHPPVRVGDQLALFPGLT